MPFRKVEQVYTSVNIEHYIFDVENSLLHLIYTSLITTEMW